ncbi:MAG TPA: hypothetical protein DCE18_09090 [Syntrophobacteraceae bacterium]|nr:hypothetical protein [Syntrophobacteraceae bacterium]
MLGAPYAQGSIQAFYVAFLADNGLRKQITSGIHAGVTVDYRLGKSVPWRPWLVSGLFLCLGIACTFYPTLLTRFSMLQADPGDSRLIHYLLEHSYRWFSGDPSHARLWDPSFFFPLPNVFSFTDTCLTLAPAYWIWRLVGCQPEVAFSLWMMTLCVANYLAAQALLRRGVGVHNVGLGCFDDAITWQRPLLTFLYDMRPRRFCNRR